LGSIVLIRRSRGSWGCVRRGGVDVTIEIDHPPGEELQFDWLELPQTPWGQAAYVLIGALSHSGC
jgi:hypothetical protein